MKTIRAATTICAVSVIAGLFSPVDVKRVFWRVGARLQNNGSPGIVITVSRETGVFNLGQRRGIYGDPGESGSSPIRSFTALRKQRKG